ncbi:MAG: DUF4365 domain-containing protein [Gemmatimonadaceae bacterium]
MATESRRGGKKVSPQVKVGQRGVNTIERIVLEMGSAWHPSNQSLDAGIDGEIELVDPTTHEATNVVVRVQSKATTRRPLVNETDDGFDWPCDARDLDYWLSGNVPVILVVVRLDTDEAYWVCVGEYFASAARKQTRRVRFDKRSMALTAASYAELSRIAVPKDRGLYSEPRPVQETLYSNLLEVTGPERLWIADTPVRQPRGVFAQLREAGAGGPEFVLRDRRLLAAYDLTERPWSSFVDRGTVEELPASHWAESDDRELRDRYIELLGHSLTERCRQIGCARRRGENLYYFAATPDLAPRSVPYRSIRQLTTRDVFLPYRYTKGEWKGEVAYYRHSAFISRFRRYGGRWYVEIEPTYHFTSDGHHQHPRYEAYLKGIKRLEKNATVLGQVVMWAALLRGREEDQASLFTPSPYAYLRFGNLSTFKLGVGIDDKSWLPNEEAAAAESVNQTAGDLPLLLDVDPYAPDSVADIEVTRPGAMEGDE